jgi:ribose 5-phosphate isomerase A
VRRDEGRLHLTDNGNYILDCGIAPLDRPAELEREIRAVPGVVGTGLFLDMKPTVLLGLDNNRVEVREAT